MMPICYASASVHILRVVVAAVCRCNLKCLIKRQVPNRSRLCISACCEAQARIGPEALSLSLRQRCCLLAESRKRNLDRVRGLLFCHNAEQVHTDEPCDPLRGKQCDRQAGTYFARQAAEVPSMPFPACAEKIFVVARLF